MNVEHPGRREQDLFLPAGNWLSLFSMPMAVLLRQGAFPSVWSIRARGAERRLFLKRLCRVARSVAAYMQYLHHVPLIRKPSSLPVLISSYRQQHETCLN